VEGATLQHRHTAAAQIRDLDTHAPMPGVRVGDVGAKMGRNGIDNGYIQFNRVRVPRSAMLARHGQVARDGERHQGA
jgi:acyl-CoA oxidase